MKIYILSDLLFQTTTNLITIHNLLSAGLRGFFYLLFLFVFCFVGVHILLLARIGWLHQTKKAQENAKPDNETEPPSKNAENKAPATSQEPIYYIVERKTKRAKSNYGEPKQFRFK